MIYPPYLRPNDTIGIVAPARKITREEVQPSIDWLTQSGFNVALGSSLFAEHHQYAGSDAARCADLQRFLDDPDIKAILCARGGYGSVRIIDSLNFSQFLQQPKWICGYSDVTVFHSHLNRLGCASIHATMCINIQNEGETESREALRQALTGETLHYRFPADKHNRAGRASGELIGGNLSILYSLLASPSDLITDGKILFIEDLDEYLYHIDRMLMALQRAGKLERLAGLIVGGMSDMHDNSIPFGATAIEIIAERCARYSFPIAFQFPAGHISPNYALRLGQTATLIVDPHHSKLILQP